MTQPRREEVRALFVVESGGGWSCVDARGAPAPLPEGVTPRHVAAMLALLEAGNATPLLACLPPRCLPPAGHPGGEP